MVVLSKLLTQLNVKKYVFPSDLLFQWFENGSEFDTSLQRLCQSLLRNRIFLSAPPHCDGSLNLYHCFHHFLGISRSSKWDVLAIRK